MGFKCLTNLLIVVQRPVIRNVISSHGKDVRNEGALDHVVEGRGGVEGGGDVDLEQPGAELFVEQHVEPEQLEARVLGGEGNNY